MFPEQHLSLVGQSIGKNSGTEAQHKPHVLLISTCEPGNNGDEGGDTLLGTCTCREGVSEGERETGHNIRYGSVHVNTPVQWLFIAPCAYAQAGLSNSFAVCLYRQEGL